MTLRIRPPSKEKISDFCRRHHIRRLSIFGSALREDFGPDSDVDVLVEFEEGHAPGFFAFIRMEEELSHLFRRKVDLRTPADLSKYFRQEVLEMAEVQYVAGH
ncbi:MAG: nucleotidyltransferase family protein [Candidatus Thorarchaeota archaeon]|nr:nucleotidyltransferase family protein [Candidatus Thorarchaeota archaeon]